MRHDIRFVGEQPGLAGLSRPSRRPTRYQSNGRRNGGSCRFGAENCTIAENNRFARKNYFYPDLPKGYQISQYESPICQHGWIEIRDGGGTKRIRIRRAHLEEDAGKNIHETGTSGSRVDLNRAGTPLLEIVTEPDMRSADEVVAYLKGLREILMYLDVCDGNMEEGSFRCEPNLSLRPSGQQVGRKSS